MPTRIKSFCVNGCAGEGVHGSRLCSDCYAKRQTKIAEAKERAEQKRKLHEGSASERGYDWAWAKVSKYVRSSEPLCRMCRWAPSEMVDHIVPLKQGGERLALDNLQPLCNKCHAIKTHKDKAQNKRCDHCGNGLKAVHVHGHIQCASCKTNINPCCDGKPT